MLLINAGSQVENSKGSNNSELGKSKKRDGLNSFDNKAKSAKILKIFFKTLLSDIEKKN